MKEKFALPLVLMVVFALTRWPGLMPQNFSAAYALAFCGGLFFSGAMAWWLPIATLVTTDVLLNVFIYGVAPVNVYGAANWLAYAALVALGRRFSRRASLLKITGGGVLGAIIFYLITNTAAWLQNPEYPKTLAGLIQALTVGTPGWPHTWEFFRNSLMSGGLFSGLFAGAVRLAESAEAEEEAEEEAPEAQGEAEPEDAKA